MNRKPLSADEIDRARYVLTYIAESPQAGYKSATDMDVVEPVRLFATIEVLRKQIEDSIDQQSKLPTELPWRTGRKVGRTLYAQTGSQPSECDLLIGILDSAEIASEAARAHNDPRATVAVLSKQDEQIADLRARVLDDEAINELRERFRKFNPLIGHLYIDILKGFMEQRRNEEIARRAR